MYKDKIFGNKNYQVDSSAEDYDDSEDNSELERALQQAKQQQNVVMNNMGKYNVNNPTYKIGSSAYNQTFGGPKTGNFPATGQNAKKDPYAIDINTNIPSKANNKNAYSSVDIDFNKIASNNSTAGFGKEKKKNRFEEQLDAQLNNDSALEEKFDDYDEKDQSLQNDMSSNDYKSYDGYDKKSSPRRNSIQLSNRDISISYTNDDKSKLETKERNKTNESVKYEDDYDEKSKDKSKDKSDSIQISAFIDNSYRKDESNKSVENNKHKKSVSSKSKSKNTFDNQNTYSKFDNIVDTKTEQSDYNYDQFDEPTITDNNINNLTKSYIAKTPNNLTNSDINYNNAEKAKTTPFIEQNKNNFLIDKNAMSQSDIYSGVEDPYGNNLSSINLKKSEDNHQFKLNYSEIDEGKNASIEEKEKSKSKSNQSKHIEKDKSINVTPEKPIRKDNQNNFINEEKFAAEKFANKVYKIANRVQEHSNLINRHNENINDAKGKIEVTSNTGLNIKNANNEIIERKDNYTNQIYNTYNKTISSSQTKYVSSFNFLKRVANEEIEYESSIKFTKKDIKEMKLEYALTEERKRKEVLQIQNEKMKEQIQDYEQKLRRMKRLEVENSELMKLKLESEMKYTELEQELKSIIADYEHKYKLAEQRIVAREEKNETRKLAELERQLKLEIHNLRTELTDKSNELRDICKEKHILEDQNSKLMIGQMAKIETDDRIKELQYENFLLHERNNELLEKLEKMSQQKEKIERKQFEKEILNKIDEAYTSDFNKEEDYKNPFESKRITTKENNIKIIFNNNQNNSNLFEQLNIEREQNLLDNINKTLQQEIKRTNDELLSLKNINKHLNKSIRLENNLAE